MKNAPPAQPRAASRPPRPAGSARVPAGSPRAILDSDWGRTDLVADPAVPGHTAAVLASALAIGIRHSRTVLRLSQTQLARAAGVSSNTVGRLEDGLTWPDLRTMGAIAAALDLPMTVTIGDKVRAGPPAGVEAAAPPAIAPLSGLRTASQAITLILSSLPDLDREVSEQLPAARIARRREADRRLEARRAATLAHHGTR